MDGGTGYTEPPTVVIEGLGTGMTAEAVIDVDRGIVTGVNPTNNGTGYFQTGNRVTLEGGFPLETRSFKVNAADQDGSVVEVTLFVNGAPYRWTGSLLMNSNGQLVLRDTMTFSLKYWTTRGIGMFPR